jgi:hypothetical protein
MKTENSVYFTFCARGCSIDWYKAVPHTKSGDNNTYYNGIVVCESDKKDTVILSFDLAPTKPIITKADFNYESFDYKYIDFIEPIYTFIVKTEKCDSIFAHCTEFYPDDWNHLNFLIAYRPKMKKIENGIYTVSYYWGWQQKITLAAYNYFGISQYSDTLLTSDYITDQKILDAINGVSSINDTSKKEYEIYIHQGYLSVNKEVQRIQINNTFGQVVLLQDRNNKIDISSLPKGIYIVTIIFSKNNKITKKIAL